MTKQEEKRLRDIEKFARLVLRWPNNGRYRTHLRALLGENIDE